jgi:hypothetical protein
MRADQGKRLRTAWLARTIAGFRRKNHPSELHARVLARAGIRNRQRTTGPEDRNEPDSD